MTAVDCVVLLGAYLLGSVLFGVVLARAVKGVDPREKGSGNPGATNVLRIAGKSVAAVALLLDAGKGAAAVLLAGAVTPAGSVLPAAAAVVAVLGHVFPIYYHFRGGKGVATALGGFLVLSFAPVVAALAVFLGVLGVFRFVSLASMVAAASFVPLSMVWGEPRTLWGAAVVVGALIVARHHENISRLRRGVEPRLGDRGSGHG